MIETHQVISSVDLGVEINNGRTALAAVIGTQLSSSGVVVAGGNGAKNSSDIGLGDELEAGTRGADIADQLLNEGSSGLHITSSLHVRGLLDNGFLVGVEAQDTGRGSTVGEVSLDLKNRVLGGSARALVVASLAVQLVGREEDSTVLSLSQKTAALAVEADVLAVSAVNNGVIVGDTERAVGLDIEGEDRMVTEAEANGQIEPLLLGRNVDAAVLGSFDLLLGTDAGVEEKTRGRERAPAARTTRPSRARVMISVSPEAVCTSTPVMWLPERTTRITLVFSWREKLSFFWARGR